MVGIKSALHRGEKLREKLLWQKYTEKISLTVYYITRFLSCQNLRKRFMGDLSSQYVMKANFSRLFCCELSLFSFFVRKS